MSEDNVVYLDKVRANQARTPEEPLRERPAFDIDLDIVGLSVEFSGQSGSGEKRADDTLTLVVTDISETYVHSFASVNMTREQWERFKDMGDKLLGGTDDVREYVDKKKK